MELLLISSSVVAGKDNLEHCREAVRNLLSACPAGKVAFVPYAVNEKYWGDYAANTNKFFGSIEQPYRSIHTCDDPVDYLTNSDIKAIFIGGGNTFLLLKTLQDKRLLEPIRAKVEQGVGYMGTSAGSNLACPTIQTTNDMPIVQPAGFKAIGLVDFQINPHFVSGPLIEGHQGETREERIEEYHRENDRAVIGLPETSWIRVHENTAKLGGGEAVIFIKGRAAHQWPINTELA